MSAITPRATLVLPGGGSTGLILPDEVADIDVLNDNFRKIDALLGARNIPSASSYTGAMDGDLVYAQDTELLMMYSSTAGALIGPRTTGGNLFKGTAAQRQAFVGAKIGDSWLDTDNTWALWHFTSGSPGTWEYSGNELRGTKAAMAQMDTDGVSVPGMRLFCTDDSLHYYRGATAWVLAPGEVLYSSRKTSPTDVSITNTATNNTALPGALATSFSLTLVQPQKIRLECSLEINSASSSTSFGVAFAGALVQPMVRGSQRGRTSSDTGVLEVTWVEELPVGTTDISLVAGATGSGGTRSARGASLRVYAE